MSKKITYHISKITNFLYKNSTLTCILVLFVFLIIYLPTLRLPFGWDDFKFLYRAHFLGSPIILEGITSNYISRPLTREIYWVVGESVGYNNPLFYRFINTLVLLLSCFIFYKILVKHIKLNQLISIFTIVLFLSHYVVLNILRWVSFNQDIFGFFFLYLTWYFILNFTQKQDKSSYILSLLSFFAALWSKETYSFFPIPLLIYWYYWKKFPLKKILLYISPFFSILGIYTLIRIIFLKPFTGYASNGSISDLWLNFKSLLLWVTPNLHSYVNLTNIFLVFLLYIGISLLFITLSKDRSKNFEHFFILLFWGLSTIFVIITRHIGRNFWYISGLLLPLMGSLGIILKIISEKYKTILILLTLIILILVIKTNQAINFNYVKKINFCSYSNTEVVACALEELSYLNKTNYFIPTRIVVFGEKGSDFTKDKSLYFASEGIKYVFNNNNLIIKFTDTSENINKEDYDLMIEFLKDKNYRIIMKND